VAKKMSSSFHKFLAYAAYAAKKKSTDYANAFVNFFCLCKCFRQFFLIMQMQSLCKKKAYAVFFFKKKHKG